jgi:hypothetical protein
LSRLSFKIALCRLFEQTEKSDKSMRRARRSF